MIDLFLAIAARIAQRFGFFGYSFLTKNLVFLAVLPVYTLYIARVAADKESDILNAGRVLEMMFQ